MELEKKSSQGKDVITSSKLVHFGFPSDQVKRESSTQPNKTTLSNFNFSHPKRGAVFSNAKRNMSLVLINNEI